MFSRPPSKNDLFDLHFQLLINFTSGRVHVNLYHDFIRPTPKGDRLAERRKVRARDGPLEKLWGGGGEFSSRRNLFS